MRRNPLFQYIGDRKHSAEELLASLKFAALFCVLVLHWMWRDRSLGICRRKAGRNSSSNEAKIISEMGASSAEWKKMKYVAMDAG